MTRRSPQCSAPTPRTMAARSAMGFAAGALRQTATQLRAAPTMVPGGIARQTRAMGASIDPRASVSPLALDPVSPARARVSARVPRSPRQPPRSRTLRSFADTRVFLLRRPPRTDEKTTGGGGPGVTHEGLTLHEPGMFHKGWAYGLGGLTWFWIFYRFYKDGDTLIYGHAPHFEHDDDDHH